MVTEHFPNGGWLRGHDWAMALLRTVWQRYVVPVWRYPLGLYEVEEFVRVYRGDFEDLGKKVTLLGRNAVISSGCAEDSAGSSLAV